MHNDLGAALQMGSLTSDFKDRNWINSAFLKADFVGTIVNCWELRNCIKEVV